MCGVAWCCLHFHKWSVDKFYQAYGSDCVLGTLLNLLSWNLFIIFNICWYLSRIFSCCCYLMGIPTFNDVMACWIFIHNFDVQIHVWRLLFWKMRFQTLWAKVTNGKLLPQEWNIRWQQCQVNTIFSFSSSWWCCYKCYKRNVVNLTILFV